MQLQTEAKTMPETWKPHERDEFFNGYWAAKKGEPFFSHNTVHWIDGFRTHIDCVFIERSLDTHMRETSVENADIYPR